MNGAVFYSEPGARLIPLASRGDRGEQPATNASTKSELNRRRNPPRRIENRISETFPVVADLDAMKSPSAISTLRVRRPRTRAQAKTRGNRGGRSRRIEALRLSNDRAMARAIRCPDWATNGVTDARATTGDEITVRDCGEIGLPSEQGCRVNAGPGRSSKGLGTSEASWTSQEKVIPRTGLSGA